jgi:hypothetical protein
MKPMHAVLILLILFAIVGAASWQMWANPVIDGGREMNAPLRLLRGEMLYSEVYYLYGPVAPAFNAILYKLAGVHLNSLYAAGIVSSLLLILAIFHISRRFMSTFESLLAAAAVLLLCVFKQGGTIVFPYSYAALYGTLFGTLALAVQIDFARSNRMWSLILAGAASGLAFCCKMEFGFAAFASLLTLVLLTPRPQRLRAAGFGLMSAAAVPVLLYAPLLMRIPADSLIKDTFILPGYVPPELIYYNKLKLGWDHPGKTLRELISALALLGGLAGLASLLGLRLSGKAIAPSRADRPARRLWWLAGVGFGLILLHMLFFGTRWSMNPFRALPILFLILILYCLRRHRREDFTFRALLIVSVYSLVVLARVIIRIPGGGGYGAGLLPVPIMLFLYIVTADFPLFHIPAEAARYRRRAVHALLATGLIATTAVLIVRYAQGSYTWLHTPRGALRQPPAITLAMRQALDFLNRNTRAGDYVLSLPEGSSLNFLADRPAPLRYEVVTPGFLSEAEEQRSIRALQEKHVEYVFLWNRPTSEFGPRIIGRDYCRTLMGWIEENYALVAVFGENVSPAIQIGDRDFFIKCYRIKNPKTQT